jgi:hypothetical protein
LDFIIFKSESKTYQNIYFEVEVVLPHLGSMLRMWFLLSSKLAKSLRHAIHILYLKDVGASFVFSELLLFSVNSLEEPAKAGGGENHSDAKPDLMHQYPES